MVRLWAEFLLLYVALPVGLAVLRQRAGAVPVLPVLWAAACPAACYLAWRESWGRREFFGLRLTGRQAAGLALRLVLAAAVLTAAILLVAPERLGELPRRNPSLWGLVMVCYPLVSVYPQGIVYRGLFGARYARLFGGGRRAWLAGAAAFSLAHLLFGNGWALAWTFAGGLLIGRTYSRSGSLMASCVEHAAYGQLVFTTGWGRYLYHGTVRLLESAGS